MSKAPLLFEDEPPACGLPPSGARVWRGLLLVVLVFLGTRLVTWTGAYYGAHTLFRVRNQLAPPWGRHLKRWKNEPPEAHADIMRSREQILGDFAPLCRFDGAHYHSIITEGYHYAPPPPVITSRRQVEQNIAFFPLYPLAVRPLAGAWGVRGAMVAVSHLCALLAGIVLYLWIRWRIDETTAVLAVALLFCWPPACYYSFGYAESLTLVLIVAALALMDRGAFVLAAVACGLATAARPTAAPIAAVFMLSYWLNRDEPRGRRLCRLVPLSLVAVGGLAAYAVFLGVRFGSPLVYFDNFRAGWVPDKIRASWLEYLTLTPVWEQFKYFRNTVRDFPAGLINLANPLMWNVPLNLFILFLSLAGLGRVPRRFRPLLWLGPLIFLQAYLASGGAKFGIEPIARYTALAVPAFVVLAAWCLREWRPAARGVFVSLLLLLQAAWAFRFGFQEWSG